jgi:hypothetical protein
MAAIWQSRTVGSCPALALRIAVLGGGIVTSIIEPNRAPFALGFMLFLKPFALTEYLQAGTVNDEVDRGAAVRPWARLQYQAVAPVRQGREIRYCDLNPPIFSRYHA